MKGNTFRVIDLMHWHDIVWYSWLSHVIRVRGVIFIYRKSYPRANSYASMKQSCHRKQTCTHFSCNENNIFLPGAQKITVIPWKQRHIFKRILYFWTNTISNMWTKCTFAVTMQCISHQKGFGCIWITCCLCNGICFL